MSRTDTGQPPQPPADIALGPTQSWRTGYVWLGCFTAAALLYSATASTGPQWQDSGAHLLRILDGQLVHPLGLALSHPLHYWSGRLAIRQHLLPPAYAITLVSAIAGALAVANVGGMIVSLTRSVPAALLAAGSLCFAHSFWKYSTVIETYTLTCALLSAEIWCLALFLGSKRPVWLIAAFCYNGLGLANHNLALLTVPLLGIVLIWGIARRHLRLPHVLLAGVGWMATSAPYTAVVVAEGIKSADWSGTLQSALFGHGFADEVLNTSLQGSETLLSLMFIGLNFPNVLLLAAIIGAAGAFAVTGIRRLGLLLLSALLIHVAFVLRYNVPDQYTFLLPTYVLLTMLGGLGFAVLALAGPWLRRLSLTFAAILLLITPAVYARLPDVLRRVEVAQRLQRGRPYRDDFIHFFTPWGCADRSAEIMSSKAIQLAGDRGVIVVPNTSAYPAVAYAARIGGHAELRIESKLEPEIVTAAARQGRRIVLVPADVRVKPPTLTAGAWRPEGDLYILQSAAIPLEGSGQ